MVLGYRLGMTTTVPRKVSEMMDRIIARVAMNPRLGQLALIGAREGHTLRVIFDHRKQLRPKNSRARGMFLSYRKNEDNSKESVIWLFFSKRKLLTSAKHRSVLVHELVHYFDFDVDMKFSRHYQNYWWNKMLKLWNAKRFDLLRIERRNGRHEKRARKIQEAYMAIV